MRTPGGKRLKNLDSRRERNQLEGGDKRKPSRNVFIDTKLTFFQTWQIEQKGYCFMSTVYQNPIDNELNDYLP